MVQMQFCDWVGRKKMQISFDKGKPNWMLGREWEE